MPGVQAGHHAQAQITLRQIFFSCARYPDCKYAVWNLPLNEPCPKCAFPILTLKTTKRRGTEKVCPTKNAEGKPACDYAEPYEGELAQETEQV